MLQNYFLICFRNIRKNKTFSSLNIVGLAIGIAACLVILQYVSFESSFENFHIKKERVYRVDIQDFEQGEDRGRSSSSSYALAPTMKATVTGIEQYTRTHLQYSGAVVTHEAPGHERRQFFEEDQSMYFVDQGFFEMFDYELVKGNRATLLTEPKSIVLTEAMVEKYLPGVIEPIGELIRVDGGWAPNTYKITGVLKDLPGNTQWSFDFLMPMEDLLKNRQYANDDGWGWTNFVSYVMLEEAANLDQVAGGVRNIINDRNEDEDEVDNSLSNVELMALTDIQLRDTSEERSAGATEESLFFFVIIALFIISIAWLNYINMSTAQSMKRAKEVGIRKVVGAMKKQLVFQFLLEAFVINLMAMVLGLGLAYMALPLLGAVLDKTLVFGEGIQPVHGLYFGAVFLLGTFLSGFYPALILSKFQPIVVIKGVAMAGNKKFGLRQVLVTAQMVIGIFLIASTLAVSKQLHFMRSQDLGMNVDQVISIRGPRVYEDKTEIEARLNGFQERIQGLSGVSFVSGSDAIPGGDYNWGTSMLVDGQPDTEGKRIKMMWVDDAFDKAYGLELLAGRFHSKDIQGEKNQVVVNETLIKKFGLGNPEEALGKKMKAGDSSFPIIGVLKDYHWYSLQMEKEAILLNYTDYGDNISVRLSTSDIRNTLSAIEEEYNTVFPRNPFDYDFMDSFFEKQYKADEEYGQIFNAFSLVAIIIACLGLFGLASFTLTLRVKEIGVRKVLGASLSSILLMIYKDYVKLVMIASVLGLPLVYLQMDSWLNDFAYRIDITWDLLLVPVLLLMAIALATISFQSFKAATSNPVKSLRSE